MQSTFQKLISAANQLQSLGGTHYSVQQNNDGSFSLFDGNTVTASYQDLASILEEQLKARYEAVYGGNYLDFPPDGFYYDYEAQIDAQLCDGIYK